MYQLHNVDKSSTGGKELMSPLFPMDSIPLGGLNSGVPTRTTATLTPTTLRNIEQTCIEIQCQVESHQNEAGFVPPVVQTSNQGLFMSVVDTKSWQGGSTRISEPNRLLTSSILDSDKQIMTSMSPPKRSTGGRKPNKDIDISPEEVERRAMRRERNKMAAARCRKRRLDHTNELVEETEDLEEKKQVLQNEIQLLQHQKEELEYILEHHKPCCRLKPPCSPPDVKPFINDTGSIITISEREVKKLSPPVAISLKQNVLVTSSRSCVSGASKRPDSLPVFPGSISADGVPLPTPTAGIHFNFDSLMEGGTGLTPVSTPLIPTCSSQQRNSGLSSPDSNKLVSL